MRTTIELPQVGESVTEGIIGKWLVEPGQRVEKYDPLVEVVTDKVSMEAPSPYSGVFTRALVEEGQTVPMGEPICEMEVDAVADAAPPAPESVAEEPVASAPEPDAADESADEAVAEEAPAAAPDDAEEASDESADDAVAEEESAAAPDDAGEEEADESADDAVAEEAPAAAPDDAGEDADESADEAVAEEESAAAPDDAEEEADDGEDEAVAEEESAAAPDDAEEDADESADDAVAEEAPAAAPDDAEEEADDGEGRVGGAWAMPAAQDAGAESAVDGESAEPEGEDAAERPKGAPSASGHPFEFVGSVRSVGPTGSGERGEGRPDAAQDASAAPREESAPPHAAAEPDRRHVVSPLVARLSAQYGIDLSTVRGTGIGGRVTSQDLLNAVSAAEEQRAAESAQSTQEDAGAADGGEPAPVNESAEAPERPAPIAESAEAPEHPAPVAESQAEPERPAPVAESQAEPERPAPVAESEEAPERPAPVAESEETPERPAPVAESAEASERPAPVAESEAAPERPAPVAESQAEPERPAPAAESEEAPERPAPVAEHPEEREEVAAPPPDARQDAASAAHPPDDAASTLPVTPIRRAIADHMARSASEIPAAWAMVEADVTGLVRAREAHRGAFERESGIPLTYLPFLASAAARALHAHPRLNARWDDGRIVVNNRVNLSVAVSTESGLMVPVARDADRLSVAELAVALRRLTDAARSGTLTLDDVQGGTFTLNNTGALGSVVSVPIINHPQAAILTTEAIVKRPVVVGEDAIAARSMMNLCASFDHRVCDGADAAAFLRAVKAGLEAMDESASLEQQAWAIC